MALLGLVALAPKLAAEQFLILSGGKDKEFDAFTGFDDERLKNSIIGGKEEHEQQGWI